MRICKARGRFGFVRSHGGLGCSPPPPCPSRHSGEVAGTSGSWRCSGQVADSAAGRKVEDLELVQTAHEHTFRVRDSGPPRHYCTESSYSTKGYCCCHRVLLQRSHHPNRNASRMETISGRAIRLCPRACTVIFILAAASKRPSSNISTKSNMTTASSREMFSSCSCHHCSSSYSCSYSNYKSRVLLPDVLMILPTPRRLLLFLLYCCQISILSRSA